MSPYRACSRLQLLSKISTLSCWLFAHSLSWLQHARTRSSKPRRDPCISPGGIENCWGLAASTELIGRPVSVVDNSRRFYSWVTAQRAALFDTCRIKLHPGVLSTINDMPPWLPSNPALIPFHLCRRSVLCSLFLVDIKESYGAGPGLSPLERGRARHVGNADSTERPGLE